MDAYLAFKHAHVGFATLTIAAFAGRGVLLLTQPAALKARFWRIAPHAIDTLLLACAIGMLAVAGIDPFRVPWLTAKIVAVLVYIALGSLAFKRARTVPGRACALLGALATVGYIVLVAMHKQPWPWA